MLVEMSLGTYDVHRGVWHSISFRASISQACSYSTCRFHYRWKFYHQVGRIRVVWQNTLGSMWSSFGVCDTQLHFVRSFHTHVLYSTHWNPIRMKCLPKWVTAHIKFIRCVCCSVSFRSTISFAWSLYYPLEPDTLESLTVPRTHSKCKPKWARAHMLSIRAVWHLVRFYPRLRSHGVYISH